MMDDRRHDGLTVMAIAALAFIIADLSHEALGHGVVAFLSGSKQIVLSYTYLSSDLQSKGISAAGPLVNLVEGLLALLLLRTFRMRAAATLFVFLLLNFNLLVGAAYLVYSGISNFGDLAVVIAGLPHLRAIRLAMDLTGLALYGAVIVVGARELRRFQPSRSMLTTTAYFTAIGLNCCAGLLNPLGLKYFLLSALPATAAANAGLFAMPELAKRGLRVVPALHVERSYPWLIAGLVTAAFFIFVVGPGLTLLH